MEPNSSKWLYALPPLCAGWRPAWRFPRRPPAGRPALPPATRQATGQPTGTVVDGATGAPVAYASVAVLTAADLPVGGGRG
ncbi:MAG: hypothetical protein WKG07_25950 [Hymenobacter sp.]